MFVSMLQQLAAFSDPLRKVSKQLLTRPTFSTGWQFSTPIFASSTWPSSLHFFLLSQGTQPSSLSRDLLPQNVSLGCACEVSAVQGTLRAYGQPLFDALANPGTVGEILKAPGRPQAGNNNPEKSKVLLLQHYIAMLLCYYTFFGSAR